MSSQADLRSTAAIEEFQLAMKKFRERIEAALAEVSSEMRRYFDWIEHEAPMHRKTQTQKAWNELTQAKVDLQRCKMFTLNGEVPACVDQKKNLQIAKSRLSDCQKKEEDVSRWANTLQHEMTEFNGTLGLLRNLIDTDVLHAIGVLEKVILQIQEYHNASTTLGPKIVSQKSGTQQPTQQTTAKQQATEEKEETE